MESLILVIVEDEEAHFHLMKRAIEKAFPHVSVHHFEEVSQCLEQLDEIAPDVIISDYLVDGMNGIEFLKILKRQDRDIPVVMITGQGNENIAVEAMKLGAADYLVKSADFFGLIPSVIEKVVRERKLKDSLERTEQRFKEIFTQSPIGIVLYDRNGLLLEANKSCLDIFGISDLADINGLKLFDDPHVSPAVKARLLKGETVRYESPFDFEKVTYETARSGTAYLEVVITPMGRGIDHCAGGYLVQFQDVTKRRQAEQALRKAHDELEKRVEERTGELAKANEELKLEIRERELTEERLRENSRRLQVAYEQSIVYAKELGEEIRERKRTEEALRDSEERYRRIVETAQEGIWMIDAEGRTQYVNQQIAKMLGYTVDELLGTFLFDFMSDVTFVDTGQNREARKRESVKQHDFKFHRKDGSDLWAMVSTSPMFDNDGEFVGALGMIIDITERKLAEDALRESQGKYSILVENSLTGIYINQDDRIVFANNRFADIYRYAMEKLLGIESWKLVHPDDRAFTGQVRLKMLSGQEAPSEYEARGLTKDGEAIWIRRRNTRIQYRGRPAILGNVVDITEEKHTEEEVRRINEELKNFVDIVSHDLKHPIIAIQGLSSRLIKGYEEKLGETGRGYLQEIKASARRMGVLVSDLLTLSKTGRVISTFCDVSSLEVVKGTLCGLEGRLTEKGIRVTVDDRLPIITCDRESIYEVFENLLTNAARFMGDSKDPAIEIGYEESENFHQFCVKDNGIGIDPSNHRKVFEMFRRLRDIEDGEGTGLGLSIVERIVHNHGGRVWVESEKGKGATFCFTLPRAC